MADEGELRTRVDDFLDLLKKEKRMSMADAAKKLGVPLQTIQSWTDFLVEEKIIGIEYKFTTPFVYIVEEEKKVFDLSALGFETRDDFFEKARKKGIKEGQISALWLRYLDTNKDAIKDVFFAKAREREYDSVQAEYLWKKYFDYLKKGE